MILQVCQKLKHSSYTVQTWLFNWLPTLNLSFNYHFLLSVTTRGSSIYTGKQAMNTSATSGKDFNFHNLSSKTISWSLYGSGLIWSIRELLRWLLPRQPFKAISVHRACMGLNPNFPFLFRVEMYRFRHLHFTDHIAWTFHRINLSYSDSNASLPVVQ